MLIGRRVPEKERCGNWRDKVAFNGNGKVKFSLGNVEAVSKISEWTCQSLTYKSEVLEKEV